ncbi:MAG: hypothetical protein ABWY93_02070 [Mycobacterium sp.]
MDHRQRSETYTFSDDATHHALDRANGVVPAIWTAVELIGIATSPVIASWLANRFGLASVALYFVLAAGVTSINLFIE